MIGKRDDRRKEEAVKKAELEKKKKEKEAVREVYAAVSLLLARLYASFADHVPQTSDAILHVLPAQHCSGSCKYLVADD